MGNQSNQENSSFYDQADGKFNQALEKNEKLSKGVAPNEEESEYIEELEENEASPMSETERQVRETEDASLQDGTYAFDEQNTGNEEYHDASGADGIDLDNDEDYIQ